MADLLLYRNHDTVTRTPSRTERPMRSHALSLAATGKSSADDHAMNQTVVDIMKNPPQKLAAGPPATFRASESGGIFLFFLLLT